MKKAISISLGECIFNIEEDAYEILNTYLESIRKHYRSIEEEEILIDIESSIAEKFTKNKKTKIITKKDVDNVIKVMGTVEEIDEETNEKIEKSFAVDTEKQEKTSDDLEANKEPTRGISKKLYRDTDDVIIAGVCSGLAAYFGIDPVFVRIIFVLLLFANGIGILAYIIFWIVMPKASTSAQKLEMQGEPVNIKKLEESVKHKSQQIRDDLKKGKKGEIIRILSFPFVVLKNIFSFFRNTISKIWPVISFLCGISIIVLSALGIAGITFVISVLLFQINSPFIVSDVPLYEFTSLSSYYILLVSTYFILVIPLIFAIILGATFIQRKNNFKILSSSILLVTWMVLIGIGGMAGLDLAPRVMEKVDEYNQIGMVEKNYYYKDFNKINLGVNGEVSVKKGDDFAIKVSGNEESLERLKFELNDGELRIKQQIRDEKGICIFCYNKPVKIEITVPELKSFIAFRNADIEIDDFFEDEIRVNAGESANIKVTLSKGKLLSYIAGTSGEIEIIGSPESIEAILEGSGRLKADNLDAEEINIDQSLWSRAFLSGNSEKLILYLEDSSRIYAKDLRTSITAVKTTDHSRAEVNARVKLEPIAQDYSEIYYKGEPEDISEKTGQQGQIIMMEDYEFEEIMN